MNEELQRLRSELDRVESKVLPFGTYQGYRITDVVRIHPAYLVWVVNNVPLQPPLRDNIVRVLREYRPRRWRPGDPPPGRVLEKPMEPAANLGKAHLRVARPTDDLAAVTRFYRDGLGFAVVGEFQDHDGFDGVMLGHAGAGYHLEFTRKQGHEAGRAPTDDNLLVFYIPDRVEWERAVRRLEAHGYKPVEPFNPYWKKSGKTFADPDGYRVVLQNAAWPA
jgi:catechol 2,3-dioxygenase-like lactoylglutathione lyase family enzyme